MLLAADGKERVAWALVDPKTGELTAPELCDDQLSAQELRRERLIHQPHRGMPMVVPVRVTVKRI